MTQRKKGILLGPGEGWIYSPAGNKVTLKVAGQDTGGAYGVTEYTMRPAPQGPRLHVHPAMEEVFYVLEGVLKMRLNDRVVDAGPGSFIFVPRGTPHTFANHGTADVRLLSIFSPPGLESYFKELADLTAKLGYPLDPGITTPLARKYGMEYIGPPLEKGAS